jgi:hypothetical protein
LKFGWAGKIVLEHLRRAAAALWKRLNQIWFWGLFSFSTDFGIFWAKKGHKLILAMGTQQLNEVAWFFSLQKLRHQKLLPYWFWGLFSFSTAFGIFWAKKGHKLILASGKPCAAFVVLVMAGKILLQQLFTHWNKKDTIRRGLMSGFILSEG